MIAAIAAAIGFGGGWTVNGWRLNAKISDINADIEKASREASEALAKQKQGYDELARQLVAKITKQSQATQQGVVARTKEIKNVQDNRVCFADWSAVRLFNEALTASDKPSDRLPKTAGGTAEGSTGASTPSVSVQDILDNQNINGARWRECREQIKLIREWDRTTFGPVKEPK